MLCQEDKEKMLSLMAENPEVSEIIHKIQANNKITISKMAHEIRNSLTLITSSLQFIEHTHPEVKEFPHWEQTLQDVKEILTTLKGLTVISSSQQLDFEMIDPLEILDSIVESTRSFAEKKSIQLDVSCDEDIPFIQGDASKLREAILNLLMNACEAVEVGGWIQLEMKMQNGNIQLTIEDNGCGIPKEKLDSIFDLFFTTKKSGTGIGLFITSEVIMAHHGTITVDSEPGKGTKFIINLPTE